MEHPVEVILDDTLTQQAHRAFVRRDFEFTIGTFTRALIPFGVLLALGFLFGGVWRYVGTGIFLVGVCIACWTAWEISRLLRDKIERSRTIISQMSQPVIRYYFSEDGVRSESELGTSQTAWKAFRRLARFPEVWLLFVDEANYIILPVPRMSSDAQQLIERKCREHELPVT